ncbi:MAG: hypothetical protein QXG86_02985 [Candidatus Woesearchaeota archaeon]
MNDSLRNASEELKRADHLIYVSLKYTRTVDVIKSILERFVTAYDLMMKALLEKKVEEKIIDSIPDSPIERANAVLSLYGNKDKVKENIDLYLLMRKIIKAEIKSLQEFRRHVTMIAKLNEGTEVYIDIDKIYEYNRIIKDFFIFTSAMEEETND